LEGTDISPILSGATSDRGSPVVLSYGHQNHAVRDDRFRYIRYRNGDEELYDHENDPHEWTNLATASQYQYIKDRLAKHFPKVNAPDVPFVGEDINIFEDEAFE
jgi:ABC-type Zn uptake system ZnuABC Zn-binding protein ZnuA